ncbi:MAG: nucleoside-diphosphate sugar epimerase/dehydratase, partial [Armatimonadota bacterium]
MILTALLVPLCHYLAGLYNRIWEYASAGAVVSIVAGVSITLLASYAACLAMGIALPGILWYVTWLTSILLVGGTRLGWRMVRPMLMKSSEGAPKRVLIYGTGPDGCALPRTLDRLYGNSCYTVGYLDENPGRRGLIIGTAKVLGTLSDLPRVVSRHKVNEVVITTALSDRDKTRAIYDACSKAGVRARSLPPLLEMIEDQHLSSREVLAEDLLDRACPVPGVDLPDNYLAGKTVLVTGAGGSIGSELCRQICQYRPARLLLLGRGENRIHWIYLYLKRRFPEIEIVPIIQNITVENGVRRVFERYRPQVVFHTAAHKHVYLMEREPVEAVRNNVVGTRILAEAAEEFGVERFVAISTDKAVAPSGVMGATKRVGELLLTTRPRCGTDFICVRFGNVLGSEGSVLEIFKRQWQRREPLTVTDPEATRFFMTIPEACLLVLQAGSLGSHGQIFLLDMGRAISIMKLAQEFILLQGGNPYDPEAIRLTGLRHGEKLHEELTYAEEELLPTADERILQVGGNGHHLSPEAVARHIDRLEAYV